MYLTCLALSHDASGKEPSSALVFAKEEENSNGGIVWFRLKLL